MRPGKPPAPVADRFWRLVDKSGDCWLWMGAKWKGYGQFGVQQSPGVWPLRKAHRVAYELIVGPIPDGMQLDHLCRNPSCVNPDHLEPVTNRENGLRGVSIAATNAKKTHCPQGHEYTFENTVTKASKHGWPSRDCRQCGLDRERAKRDRLTGVTAHQCPTCSRFFASPRGLNVHSSKYHGIKLGYHAANGVQP